MVRPSLLLAAGLLSVASAGLAAQAGRISYESFALPNGLRVVYSEDHSTPIVTVDLWYRVGSRNERPGRGGRSEEHTSELQSRLHLVCRLLLEKKKNKPRQGERPT